ncbi:MAG: hypothetical protein NG747_07765 [Candidatus Brocadia sp.]|nr:hypothetical protein [Candidatus Brocadia sp.]
MAQGRLPLPKNIVDAWIIYDNSGSIPKLLDWGGKDVTIQRKLTENIFFE